MDISDESYPMSHSDDSRRDLIESVPGVVLLFPVVELLEGKLQHVIQMRERLCVCVGMCRGVSA